jgi:hypothetical protein
MAEYPSNGPVSSETSPQFAPTSPPPGHQAGAAARRSRPYLAPIACGLLGFICGAVVWHFIGFWSTFHDILVRNPARHTAQEHRVAQFGSSCATLTLDRSAGVTRAGPCPTAGLELAEAMSLRRDRLRDIRTALPHPPTIDTNWTVTVNEGAEGTPAAGAMPDAPEPPLPRLAPPH